jgi:predicted transcriptional regulator
MIMKEAIALRRETKKYIDQADVKIIKMIHALLEAEKESDWYDDLSEGARASIERGLKDEKAGRTTPHEVVMKRYQKWRLK